MKRILGRGVLAGTLVALLTCVPAAFADPLIVTGGSVNLNWDGLSSFHLTGDNFTIGGDLFQSGAVGFLIGATVDLSRPVSVNSEAGRLSTVTIDGTTYPRIMLQGMLDLRAVPFVAPAASNPNGNAFSTPFTMTGTVRGFSDRTAVTPLFDVTLAGSGIATVGGLINTGHGDYVNRGGVFYQFAPPASQVPTPEPASLFLLSTGLAGGVIARRRRKAATSC